MAVNNGCRHIEWLQDGEQAPAWTLDFHDITMHAIVRADGESPAALYLQVCADDGDGYISSEEEAADSMAENGDSTLRPDLWLIPADPAIVSVLYDAFSKGAERNPDEDSESDEEGGIFFNEDEVFGASELALNRQEIAEVGDSNRHCPGTFGKASINMLLEAVH